MPDSPIARRTSSCHHFGTYLATWTFLIVSPPARLIITPGHAARRRVKSCGAESRVSHNCLFGQHLSNHPFVLIPCRGAARGALCHRSPYRTARGKRVYFATD